MFRVFDAGRYYKITETNIGKLTQVSLFSQTGQPIGRAEGRRREVTLPLTSQVMLQLVPSTLLGEAE